MRTEHHPALLLWALLGGKILLASGLMQIPIAISEELAAQAQAQTRDLQLDQRLSELPTQD